MIKPIATNYKGLISCSGPTRSGKSQLAEFLFKEKNLVTYIATSKPRPDDPEWQQRIDIHRRRRPNSWSIIENPNDICGVIESIRENESVLIDSLGGLVEDHLKQDNYQWNIFQKKLLKCLTADKLCIVVVSEEVGWGVVPATQLGHIFRERLSTLNSSISRKSKKRWLAVNGTAIDLDKIGHVIP